MTVQVRCKKCRRLLAPVRFDPADGITPEKFMRDRAGDWHRPCERGQGAQRGLRENTCYWWDREVTKKEIVDETDDRIPQEL